MEAAVVDTGAEDMGAAVEDTEVKDFLAMTNSRFNEMLSSPVFLALSGKKLCFSLQLFFR